MRHDFSKQLLTIGNGRVPVDESSGLISFPSNFCNFVSSKDELINKVFPDIIAYHKNTKWLSERAILAAKNKDVDDLNFIIQNQIAGTLYSFKSIDCVTNEEEATNYPTEFLNSLDVPGLPPHNLQLKVGSVVIMLRNLNQPKLCNGTRLVIRKLMSNVILASILKGKFKDEEVFIPRIPMIPTDIPFEFKRIQFPIRLAFAMTINKSQGQSLTICGLNLENTCFSHGQLYVACSCVGKPSALFVLAPDQKTKNVVYHKIKDEEEARAAFNIYQTVLILLVQVLNESKLTKGLLKRMCKIIQEFPSWNAAHICAFLELEDCFKDAAIERLIKIATEDYLETPLHVAVRFNNINACKELIKLNCETASQDKVGNTPFHLATTKEIIKVLCKKPEGINYRNEKGFTPYHIFCMDKKFDMVLELLKFGANINISFNQQNNYADETPLRPMEDIERELIEWFSESDIQKGGTPLHWSETPDAIELLITHGCNKNSRNFEDESALHIMIKYGRLDCVIKLLLLESNPDIPNSYGDTPLHLAVKSGNTSMVHALLVFDAQFNLLNNNSASPRHLAALNSDTREILVALHASGAERCSLALESCQPGCTPEGSFDSLEPENCTFSKTSETVLEEILYSKKYNFFNEKENDRATLKVLCLDGGGIKGLVMIQLLIEMEKLLQVPIFNLFNYFSGTSTGGILALAIATGKNIKECRSLYFSLKDKVFVGSRPYSSDSLEVFLKRELGETTRMRDIENVKVLITATRADRIPLQLKLYRNFESPLKILGHMEVDEINNEVLPESDDELIWKVARATGAAPTYFTPLGPYIDGGLISNNPTMDTIAEIQRCNQALLAKGKAEEVERIKVLVSMGTGRSPLVSASTFDVSFPSTLGEIYNLPSKINETAHRLADQVTEANGSVTDRVKAVCDMVNLPYIRLNPSLSQHVDLNEKDNSTLLRVMFETKVYMRYMNEKLTPILSLLKN